MLNYYTTIILLTWMILIVLSILIKEDNRIAKKEKMSFYLTYMLIASAALAEWIGINLNGHTNFPNYVLLAVKCIDYTLTPMAGGALLEQIYKENPKERKLLWGLFIGNMIFQILASFFGWMIIVDEYNNYSRGPLYFIYIIVYLTVITSVIFNFVAYGNNFRRKNRASLYAIIVFVLFGIAIQEALNSDIRTAYLSMTVGACLMFIHYTEFEHQKSDDSFSVQHLQLMTDSLTGVRSRYAYSEMLKSYKSVQKLPDSFVVFSMDINGLKEANDMLGHEAGDELICGAAYCIKQVTSGECFRTGGDEFIVLSKMDKEQAENVLYNLELETNKWSGDLAKKISISAGYAMAVDYPECSIEELVQKSDRQMYAAKSQYYLKSGKDRRK